MQTRALSLLALLLLQVLVGKKAKRTTEDDDGVQANTEAGGTAGLSRGGEGAGGGSLGPGVTGLRRD